jgi:nitrogen fixation NifU-like protein
MKSTQYSEKVLDHFRNPRNIGTLTGEDVVAGEVGNPVNGDLMRIYLKVKDNTIADVTFQTFGCSSAIATSSMITEMVKGKTLDEALLVAPQDVADALDGLPPAKMHCSNQAVDALREAINNYKTQQLSV